MSKSRGVPHLVLVAAAAGALAFNAAPANADGHWVPGTPMTDSQYVTDWSGVYVGGKLGGAWSDIDWTQDLSVFSAAGAAAPGTPVTFGPSGIAGGVFGGANLQMGQWIFSLEASYIGLGLSESATSPFFPATDTFQTDIEWLATVEPRIGYTWNRTFAFVKGGWAGGDATFSVSSPVRGSASTKEFVDGWTIGGGLEYACWSSVILGIEYQHITLDLADAADCPLCAAGIPIGTPSSVAGTANIDAVMARASYLFRPED
jgi:outer membrane immunogenic protein